VSEIILHQNTKLSSIAPLGYVQQSINCFTNVKILS